MDRNTLITPRHTFTKRRKFAELSFTTVYPPFCLHCVRMNKTCEGSAKRKETNKKLDPAQGSTWDASRKNETRTMAMVAPATTCDTEESSTACGLRSAESVIRSDAS